MSNNRDLLKEAIADAKAVKETAIANAKAALEEAFTPHLKSMLAAKLEEMDKEDVDEGYDKYEEDDMKEEVSEEVEAVEENEEVKEAKKEEIDEEEINLDELLAELEEGEDKDEVKESEEIEESEEVTEQEEDEAEEEGEDEEAEGEMEEEEIDLEDMTEDDLKSFIEDVIKDMVEAGELEAGEEMESEEEGEDAEIEDEMDIEVEDEAEEIMESEEVEEYGSTRMKEPSDAAASGLENIVDFVLKNAEKGKDWIKKNFEMGSMQQAMASEGLEEIEELKKELQEVNLLNAKLLYTNKIFKSKNLSEDKKVKVLKAFDKAETVKEAKIIFETLNEGMVSKNPTVVNEIKGSASKATGIAPKAKQPIVENAAFARMQRLAGIIKEN